MFLCLIAHFDMFEEMGNKQNSGQKLNLFPKQMVRFTEFGQATTELMVLLDLPMNMFGLVGEVILYTLYCRSNSLSEAKQNSSYLLKVLHITEALGSYLHFCI